MLSFFKITTKVFIYPILPFLSQIQLKNNPKKPLLRNRPGKARPRLCLVTLPRQEFGNHSYSINPIKNPCPVAGAGILPYPITKLGKKSVGFQIAGRVFGGRREKEEGNGGWGLYGDVVIW
jgi:hypothetical protein